MGSVRVLVMSQTAAATTSMVMANGQLLAEICKQPQAHNDGNDKDEAKGQGQDEDMGATGRNQDEEEQERNATMMKEMTII